jgi:transcriptional regulator with XRE-family HTH domain
MEKILGQALKKERETHGLSLAAIASETRIDIRHLQALENEDFSLFPGSFYIRYYIKNYLKACGADEAVFFKTYQENLKAVLEKAATPAPDQYLNKLTYVKFRKSKKILIAFLLLIVLTALFYFFRGRFDTAKKIFVPGSPGQFTFPAFSELLLPCEADFCLDEAPISIGLAFEGSCWLQLWRGNEKTLEKTFVKGDTFASRGYQLTLFMGNPGAVRLLVNGREVSRFRQSSGLLKLLLNPENLKENLLP